MNLKPEELVKALRCTATPGGPTGDCEMCPYYRRENLNDELKEKLGTDTWTSCDIDKVGMDAADQIERDQKEIAELRELAVADQKGRVIVLPCKVGDTVWLTRTWVSERLSQPEAAALTGAYICGNDVCTFVTNKYGFQQDKIGKNVFLTREEAEKALAEMERK